MHIKALNCQLAPKEQGKLNHLYTQFNQLIDELAHQDLPHDIVHTINIEIDTLNSISSSSKAFKEQIIKTQSEIIKLLEKELQIVPRNHYRNTWLAIGMAAFGIPLGALLGVVLNNMAFIGLGLPIGMVIGMAVGTNRDKKALESGKQLNIEIKF